MPSIDKLINYAKSKHHKVRYSMHYPERLGDRYLDCSSFVYYALIAGEFLPKYSIIGNTETLYKLNGKIFQEVYFYDQIMPGDIFIRGREGSSAGAAGHTGIFLRKGEIIHCNALNDTVTINNESSFIRYYLDCERSINERYFRPITKSVVTSKPVAGCGVVRATTNVREMPSTSANIVARYHKGDVIYYDSLIKANGYEWISYIGNESGLRRYVAYKDDNDQRIDV